VTCLYDLARREETNRRSVGEYLALAPQLLSSRLPMVVFADPEHLEALRQIRSTHAPGVATRFVGRQFEDLNRYGQLPRVMRCLAQGRRSPAAQNLEKDTARYHVLTWSKIDLLAEVAADDPFDSAHLWWIDLGFGHVVQPHPDHPLDELLTRACAPLRFTLVREIAPAQVHDRDRYLATASEPSVCGVLFGGDRASIGQLATWFDAEVGASLAAERPALEEVLLGPVVAEHRAAFTVSYGSHTGVLKNLLEPRSDAWLLCRVLAQCRDLGLDDHGLDLAGRMERAWRAGQLELSWQEVARLYSDGAAMAWDTERPTIAASAERRLAELIERAPRLAGTADGPVLVDTSQRATVALCMIVRNEAHVIDRCLESVRDLIDAWVIVDTGSTDGTPAKIKQALEGTPGSLYERPWKNFGHNRTELLGLARGTADYLLLLDADMTLEPIREFPDLHSDAYVIRHTGSLDYAIPRLVRGDQAWHYVGATHEYLAWEGERSIEELHALRVVHHGDGSSHAVKLNRDRELLEQALADRPDDPRSLFYLARTYADLGDDDAAINLFRRRVAVGGWDEEVFYAQYQLGCLLARADWGAGSAAFADAWRRRPTRAEPLHELARGWQARGRPDLAFEYASRGLEIEYPTDALFVHRDHYEYGLRFARAIAAYQLSDFGTALADNDRLLAAGVPRDVEAQVRANRSRCLQNLGLRDDTPPSSWPSDSSGVPHLGDLIPETRNTLVSIPTLERWPSTNPSIATGSGGQLRMIMRTVNYRLTGAPRYYRQLDADSVVRTRNYLVDLEPSDLVITAVRPLTMVPGERALSGPVVGVEDARLIELRDRWVVSGTVRDRNDEWRCEMALVDVDGDHASSSLRVLAAPFGERDEKNWMPFIFQGQLRFVYSLQPTVVLGCDVRTGEVNEVSRQPAPDWASGLRGGSQGLAIGDGYLFVAHEVEWSAGQRDYVHRLVYLNAEWQIDAASPTFRFLAPGVEFCAGIAPVGDDLLLSFGSEDRAAYLARAPLKQLVGLLEPVGGVSPAGSPNGVLTESAID